MNTAFLNDTKITAPKSLLAQAKNCPAPRVVIAQAGATLPMQAAMEATQAGLMTPIFTGDANEISVQAIALGWDISQFEIVDTDGEEDSAIAAARLCGEGRADVLMKGHLHTDVFMKAALNRDAGLRTDERLVHIFHMTQGDSRPLLISDAAVNVTPDIKTRQSAVIQCAKLMRMLGQQRPKIAILSATETPIPSVPSSIDAKDLSDWAASEVPDADVSGPLAMDLILSRDAAKTKGLDDPVAGNADAIIVPDIVSGNALFKALVYTAGACAAGVVMGAKVPILLTSRADPAEARLASIALAAIIANAS
ncbi:phosphate acetyl/butyryl transferase [Amylibacter ulvae]|uniref:Phosphate acetyl/butyryl transferase n=1 Tax=Paramylibacter ulvae TaxID=1651968 RepID=A0ABQ3D2P2_9RHOB|nr:bifunctional enoyl-CoA hydratase/phosphate acetyltransferase [Amylibacter ulvae]GHA54431.1 phosphate acetyl/butyryl transferase [Amylibacter ulvae]